MGFVHLHLHTTYSLQDGMLTPAAAAKAAKDNGMSAVAITDHGVMYGVIDFYQACKAEGVKPIIGMEAYKAPGSIYDKIPSEKESFHLVLLAKNNTGYHNLMKLASIASTQGFYYKPRVDFKLLEKYHEGLIALSACVQGEIPQALLADDYDRAKELAQKYQDIFGEDFYLELQWHGIEEERIAGPGLIRLSTELGIPLVATNDVHYLKKSDAEAQHTLMAISTKKRVDDPTALGYGTPDEMYFKSEAQMVKIFGNKLPEAIENTQKIADMCNVEIEMGNYKLPKFPTPDGFDSNEQYFDEICANGYSKRYGDGSDKLAAQLKYEMDTIKKMGFVDYFLIVSDFIRYAKRNGIYVGPGRGSAAGSMVSYVMEITELDPIKYNLVFERFLNPERITMPDIDVDFEVPDGREEVLNYVANKYGMDHVAHIITYGTLAAKTAIHDVAKALGMEPALENRLAKMIPKTPGITIKQAMEQSPELRNQYKGNSEARKVLDLAIQLEGTKRHTGVHAAGLIIAPGPVTDYIPVRVDKLRDDNGDKTESSVVVSQYDMAGVETIGMLKVDFLGLRNLTIQKNAVEEIKAHKGVDLNLNNLPLDSKEVYEMLSRGESNGVFQLESEGMKKVLMDLKPTCIEDLIACVALYRPGPMDSIPQFIENKHHPEKVTYKQPALEPILKDTYGILVYQEQVMAVVRDIAGYSYGRSDLVRRVMSKKKKDKMAAEKDIFINGEVVDNKVTVPGALRMGVSLEVANALWDEMSKFAEYAFNRAHAACYGIIAYQTAYLKAFYPLEYQAAMMTNASDNPDKLLKQIADCASRGIKLAPPDINRSGVDFEVENDRDIRFGLVAIKGVGRAVMEEIVMERNSNGLYSDIVDLACRCQLTNRKNVLAALIKSGALDNLGANRAQMLLAIKPLLAAVAQARKTRAADQLTIESAFFGGAEDVKSGLVLARPIHFEDVPEMNQKFMLAGELESTGMYISGHPMTEYAEKVGKRISHYIHDLADSEDDAPAPVESGTQVRIAGFITSSRVIQTKKGKPMAFATVEDQTGAIETTIFPKTYEAIASKFANGIPVLVFGKLEDSDDYGRKVIADSIEFLEDSPAEGNAAKSGD